MHNHNITPAKQALFKILSMYGINELTEQELEYDDNETIILFSSIAKYKTFRKLYIDTRRLSKLNRLVYFMKHADEVRSVSSNYWLAKFLNVGR